MAQAKQPSLKKNILFKMAYEVLLIIAPFVTAPYISRVLGAELIGIKSYTEAIVAYFNLFAVLGTTSYGTREVARVRDDKQKVSQLFWEIEILQFLTGGVVLICWVIFTALSGEYQLFYRILTIELVATMLGITWFFNGFEKFDFVVVRNSIVKIATIAATFIFIKGKDDLPLYVFILMLSKLLSAVVTYTVLPKYLVKTKLPDLGKHLRQHFSQTIVYFIPAIANTVNKYLDKILLGMLIEDKRQNGFYEQTEKIIHLIKQIVFFAINGVLGVRCSYLFAQKKYDEIKQKINFSMEYICFFGVSCALGLAAVARRFIPLFYGPGYEPVITLTYIFCSLPLIQGISSCVGSLYYIPSGNRKQSSNYLIVGSIVNVVLNAVFIPFFGVYAAAATTVFAQLVIDFLYIHNCNGYMSFFRIFQILWKKLISGVVMFAIVMELGKLLDTIHPIWCVLAQVITGALVYGGMELLLRDTWLVENAKGILKKVAGRFR